MSYERPSAHCDVRIKKGTECNVKITDYVDYAITLKYYKLVSLNF